MMHVSVWGELQVAHKSHHVCSAHVTTSTKFCKVPLDWPQDHQSEVAWLATSAPSQLSQHPQALTSGQLSLLSTLSQTFEHGALLDQASSWQIQK